MIYDKSVSGFPFHSFFQMDPPQLKDFLSDLWIKVFKKCVHSYLPHRIQFKHLSFWQESIAMG